MNDRIDSLFSMLQSPNYGHDIMQRQAAASAPTLNDFMAMQHATGGSSVLAHEQFQAAQQRSRADAFNAAGSFESNRIGSLIDLTRLSQDRDQFSQQLSFQRNEGRRVRKAGFMNSLLGIGGSLLGTAVGGPAGAAAGGAIMKGIGGLFGGGGNRGGGMTAVNAANSGFDASGIANWRAY